MTSVLKASPFFQQNKSFIWRDILGANLGARVDDCM